MTSGWIITELLLFMTLIIFSGIFSSAEVAYTGLSLGQINRIKLVRPRLLDIWLQKPDLVLAVLLLSNNAVNIAVGVIAAGMAFGLSHHTGIPLTILSTSTGILSAIVLLVWGEIVPKVWAKHYPVTWTLKITPFMNLWIRCVQPIAHAAVWITNKIVLGRYRVKSLAFPLRDPELQEVVTHSTIPYASRHILNNLMEFSEATVRDVMTPRSKIESVSIKEPLSKIVKRVIKLEYSRIPIFSGTIDNIIGVLYTKDLLVAWRSLSLIVIEDLVRPILRVKADLPLSELMRTFRTGRHHLALVEEPNSSKIRGLVTLEDAIETIVGEIEEE